MFFFSLSRSDLLLTIGCTMFNDQNPCNGYKTAGSPSCLSKVNCKLQTRPRDRRHVTPSRKNADCANASHDFPQREGYPDGYNVQIFLPMGLRCLHFARAKVPLISVPAFLSWIIEVTAKRISKYLLKFFLSLQERISSSTA